MQQNLEVRMIYFDNLTLKAFVEENSGFFENARIQKIQQPTRRDFIFTLRNNGETRKFYINIDKFTQYSYNN